jgi:thioesterase domain-containing protein
MTGYHKDPEATRNAVDGDGWLHTGDRGLRDSDGYFFHRGREKELIIKAGTNISPVMIDETLLSHPKVAEAAAVGVPHPLLGEDIVAFVVLERGAELMDDNLPVFCEDRIGAFSSPSDVFVVDSLPRAATGKVLRHELAARVPPRFGHSSQAAPPSPAYLAPQSTLEKAIADIWGEVLRCDRVGRSANFFALGGNSISALRVLARVRERLGAHLPLSTMFEGPTVAEQAASIEAERLRSTGTATDESKAILLLPVVPGCEAMPLFAAYGLSRYRVLAERLGPEQPVYGLLVEGEIEVVRGHGTPIGVEELARRYVIAARRIQPTGPYQLLGFSFGGRVALEMAHQLRSAGEDVALVAAVDTFMPGAARRRWLTWLAFHLSKVVEHGLGYATRRVRRRFGRDPSPNSEAARMRHHEATYRSRSRVKHRPEPYEGKVVLFRASESSFAAHTHVDPFLGWGGLARGELVVEDIPGRHNDMPYAPAIDEIAARLRPHLAGRVGKSPSGRASG